MRAGRPIAVAVLAAALGGAPSRAQDPPPAIPEAPAQGAAAPAPRWSFDLSALAYFLPDDEDYVQPMVVARRGALHLEARYNYEDMDTASLFGGWVFDGGSEVEWEVVPILGAVVGRTDGVASGFEFSLAWRQLAIYSENEYVVDFADRESNFFYDWTEVTWEPTESFGAGLVTQRTRVYATDRDLQRGVMARYSRGAWSGTVYWFNPGSSDDFVAISAGAGF